MNECYIYTRRDKTGYLFYFLFIQYLKRCTLTIIIIYYYPIIGCVCVCVCVCGGGGNCHLKKKKQKYIIKFISRKTYIPFTSQHAPPIKVITVTQL